MKFSKSLLSIALMFTLVIGIFLPATSAEAGNIKINQKTATLYVGKSIDLKISGTKKTVTWATTKKNIATVSKTGKVTAKRKGKAIITATIGKTSYSCKIIVLSGDIVRELKNSYITMEHDMWEEGFYDVSWYVTTGKNYYGSALNIAYILEYINASMKELETYDTYIINLSGSQYTDLKASWKRLYKETIHLHTIIKTTTPPPGDLTYVFNTEAFETYLDEYYEEIEFFN